METNRRQCLEVGTLRFGQLRRHVPEATRKVLTEQLRELEEDQIIARKPLGQRWERVDYALTSYGRTLVPVLTLMAKWGKTHKKSKEAVAISRDCGDEEQLVQSEGPRVYKGTHSGGRNGNPGSAWRSKGERRWQRRC